MSKMITVKLDGIDYEAAPEVANALTKAQADRDALKHDVERHLATATTTLAERDALKAKLDAAEKRDISKEIIAGVKARVALHEQAREALPKEEHEKLDEMTDDEIRRAVIAAALPSFKLEGRTDSDITTAFEIAIGTKSAERTDEGRRADALAKQREKAAPRHDASTSRDAVIKSAMDRINNQWKPDYDPKAQA